MSPLLSIGLPVYNGEPYLEASLDSILNQDFGDFELIVSDNASTDRPESICRDYASRDSRIHYFRNTSNMGGAWNFKRVFQLSSAKYFKWITHDDLYASTFLSKCLAVLESDPTVVLCTSRCVEIDEHGNPIKERWEHDHGQSPDVRKRVRDMVLIDHYAVQQFGIIRRDALAKTSLLKRYNYVASDLTLMLELALQGRLHNVPENLFFRRNHPQNSINVYSPYARTWWYDAERAKRIRYVFPEWRIFFEYVRAVTFSDISPTDKLHSYIHLARWFKWRWKSLQRDLEVAFRYTLGKIENPYRVAVH